MTPAKAKARAKKPLSPAQLEQRRAAAKSRGKQLSQDIDHQRRASRALRAKVGVGYYKWLGHLGWLAQQRNQLKKLAETFEPGEDERKMAKSQERLEWYKASRRKHFAEWADSYKSPVPTGQMVMYELFQDGTDVHRRGRKSHPTKLARGKNKKKVA
jgi:hypothetical protein